MILRFPSSKNLDGCPGLVAAVVLVLVAAAAAAALAENERGIFAEAEVTDDDADDTVAVVLGPVAPVEELDF